MVEIKGENLVDYMYSDYEDYDEIKQEEEQNMDEEQMKEEEEAESLMDTGGETESTVNKEVKKSPRASSELRELYPNNFILKWYRNDDSGYYCKLCNNLLLGSHKSNKKGFLDKDALYNHFRLHHLVNAKPWLCKQLQYEDKETTDTYNFYLLSNDFVSQWHKLVAAGATIQQAAAQIKINNVEFMCPHTRFFIGGKTRSMHFPNKRYYFLIN